MVLVEIPRDAAVLISPGGRLRVLSPRDAPLPANRKLLSLDDQRGYVYLPGYKVTHDFPPTKRFPYLLARGHLDGTNWEELHDELCKTESKAKGVASRRRQMSSYEGIDVVEYFLREPEHSGFFWTMCRGIDGRITIRTDTLGQHPLLYHRVPHDSFSEAQKEKQSNIDEPIEGEHACDWLIAPAPAPFSNWPKIQHGWKQHHPRHVLRIDTQTCAFDPVAGVSRFDFLEHERKENEKKMMEEARKYDQPPPTFEEPVYKNAKNEIIENPFRLGGLLPLVPPSLRVPPSHELDFKLDPDLPPELQKKPPVGLPIRLTEDGDEKDNENIFVQSRELTKRLLASTKHCGLFLNMFRRGITQPIGVLFSGGIDAIAVLATLKAWGIPTVAAVAGFIGGLTYPEDIKAAKVACQEMEIELIIREVGSVAEVTSALARLAPSLCHLDTAKAKTALATYFASEALKNRDCIAILGGGGADGLLNGVELDVDDTRASAADELTLELSNLRNVFHKELQRDHAACNLHGLELFRPFLSAFIAQFALDVPGRMKRLMTDKRKKSDAPLLRKRILRVSLERHPFNLSRNITRRQPMKPEIGSYFGDAVSRVALSLGFNSTESSLAEAVASCAYLDEKEIENKAIAEQKPEVFDYFQGRNKGVTNGTKGITKGKRVNAHTQQPQTPPPPAQFALLYTSGRNSACAFHKATNHLRRRCVAVVPFSCPTVSNGENFKSGQRHGRDAADVDPNVNVDTDSVYTKGLRCAAARFADSVDLPLWNRGVPGYTSRTRFRKSNKQAVDLLSKSFKQLRADYGILGVVHGHVYDTSALCAVEEACEQAGLVSLAPVWRDDKCLQNMLADDMGAAKVLVTTGSPSSLGTVVTEPSVVDELIHAAGGSLNADGDACGVTFDVIPSEAVFYNQAAVVWGNKANRFCGNGKSLHSFGKAKVYTHAQSGVGAHEIDWGEVSVVRRPAPPKQVRNIGGRGWPTA